MYNLKLHYIFLITLYFYIINAQAIIDEIKYEKNQCADVCTDSFFLLPEVNNAGNVCERGCRFFNIIYLTDGHDINGTKQQCYTSCKEAYSFPNEGIACITGCNAMAKKKEIDLANVFAFIEQDSTKNFLLETEIEILEADILSDPVIKNQIELGYSLDYKIPETKIRTMPIGEIIERRLLESKIQTSGDWLDCASKNSGIPKSILLTAILIATVIVLILLVSSARDRVLEKFAEENENKHDIYDIHVQYENQKTDLSKSEEENFDDLKTLIDNEINFSDPPKYQNQTEKI